MRSPARRSRGTSRERVGRGLGRIDHGDAAAVAVELVERIERHGVVGAVKARLHDHEAVDAARRAKLLQRGDARLACEVSAVGNLRIVLDGTNDMDVTVTAHEERHRYFKDRLIPLPCERVL